MSVLQGSSPYELEDAGVWGMGVDECSIFAVSEWGMGDIVVVHVC